MTVQFGDVMIGTQFPVSLFLIYFGLLIKEVQRRRLEFMLERGTIGELMLETI